MNELLALLTVGLSGWVGVAQLRVFWRTRRTWRLVVGIVALSNSAAGVVILALLLAGVFG